jgi:hypothetical protein
MHQDQTVPLIERPSNQTYAGAMAASLGGALAFLAVFLLRGGLGDHSAAIAMLYLLAIVPVWLSAWALSTFGASPFGRAFALTAALILGTLVPLLGLVSGPVALVFAAAVLLTGLWCARQALASMWRARAGLVAVAVLSGALLVLLTVPTRLYMREALLLGTANSDNYLHAANMQMLMHYGRIAIGGDGLGYQNYHWLFHFLVAGAAKATNADVVLVYGYWTGLVLKLQLAWALFMAGLVLHPTDNERSTAWRFAYAWFVMLLAGGFEMESYLLGIALFMGWIPLLLALLRAAPSTAPPSLAGLTALTLGAFVCAGAKASVGYYCAIGLFLLAWHYRARLSVVISLLTSLTMLAVFANTLLIPKDLLLGNAGLPTIVVSYLMYVERGILPHYLLAPLLALIFIWRPRGTLDRTTRSFALGLMPSPSPLRDTVTLPGWLARRSGLAKPLRWLALADERAQLLLLSLFGTLFVLFTMPIGDNLWDFSVILFMMSLLLLPAALGETINAHFTDRPVKWLLGSVLAAETILACTRFAFTPVTSLPQTLVALYRSATGIAEGQSTGAARDIVISLKSTHKPLARLNTLIEGAPISRLKQDLDYRSQAANGRLAVQVPPEATEIWHFFEKNDGAKWCLYPHLLVPATAGVVEIRSIPSADLQKNCMIPGVVWYGYGKYQDLHRTADFTPRQLCTIGRTMGVRRIYRLNSLSDLSRNQVTDCPLP